MAAELPESVRLFVLDRDNYQCQVCGLRGDDLHVHHIHYRSRAYTYAGDIHDSNNLAVLCAGCHDALHRGRLHVIRTEVSPGVWAVFWEET